MHVHGKASDFHPTSQILHFFYKIGKIHVTKKKTFSLGRFVFHIPLVSGIQNQSRRSKHLPWFENKELKPGIKHLFFPWMEYKKRLKYNALIFF